MIPRDPDDLHVLAGEYVLGTLDPATRREIEAALPGDDALARAVAFWETRLNPLAALAPVAEPPAGTWDAIAAGIAPRQPFWSRPDPWRWATAVSVAAAAALALYIAATPSPAPRYVALLHPPQQEQTGWVATVGGDGLTMRQVAGTPAPDGHAFQLWAIAPGATRPQPLGVIPADGVLRLAAVPAEIRDGATLAISVEPPGGSPTGQPTGPVVFVGAVRML